MISGEENIISGTDDRAPRVLLEEYLGMLKEMTNTLEIGPKISVEDVVWVDGGEVGCDLASNGRAMHIRLIREVLIARLPDGKGSTFFTDGSPVAAIEVFDELIAIWGMFLAGEYVAKRRLFRGRHVNHFWVKDHWVVFG